MEIEEGWKSIGITSIMDQCLRQLDELWTDMRPLSIRRQIDAQLKRAEKIRDAGG